MHGFDLYDQPREVFVPPRMDADQRRREIATPLDDIAETYAERRRSRIQTTAEFDYAASPRQHETTRGGPEPGQLHVRSPSSDGIDPQRATAPERRQQRGQARAGPAGRRHQAAKPHQAAGRPRAADNHPARAQGEPAEPGSTHSGRRHRHPEREERDFTLEDRASRAPARKRRAAVPPRTPVTRDPT